MAASYIGFTGAIFAVIFIQLVSACINLSPPTPPMKCCSDIGGTCFGNSIAVTYPMCPDTYSPKLYLFTRNNAYSAITFTASSIPPEFSNDRNTIFIVHGWRDYFSTLFISMKDKLLSAGDYNIVAADWNAGASDPYYVSSAANTMSMGALIGIAVMNMRQASGSNPNYWCIGHSLGAHVCGFTSITALPVIDRITGLDPSAASFIGHGLSTSSATQVDIIHTDPVLGLKENRGTVDFYPNGGEDQPGCPHEGGRRKRGTSDCSHRRSIEYMIASIDNPTCYPAKQVCTYFRNIPGSCTNITDSSQYGMMGYNAPSYRYSGMLHMVLSFTAPYCTTS